MLSIHVPSVDSTNEYAKQLLSSHDEVYVTADIQTNGKGRNGKVWNSGNAKDILFSHGKRIRKNIEHEPQIMQACAALSVQAFLLHILPQSSTVRIKYPNDVYVKHADNIGKISGSLIETEYSGNTLTSIVTGIGININSIQEELATTNQSISVKEILGHECDLNGYRIDFVHTFTSFLSNKESVWTQWKDQLNILSKTVHILSEHNAYVVSDILDDGRLLCLSGKEERIIHSGDSIIYDIFE